MKNLRYVVGAGLLLALVTALVLPAPASGAEDETPLVRKQCESFVAAWNAHDAKAMAAIFTDDADMIDPMGVKHTGRADIEKAFASDHGSTGPMRESKLAVQKEPLRFVTPDVALTDADVVISDAYGPDGKKGPPLNVHVTSVWKKVGGKWLDFGCRAHVTSPSNP
jgi:uncharacterized protein (TIGR02246 family)